MPEHGLKIDIQLEIIKILMNIEWIKWKSEGIDNFQNRPISQQCCDKNKKKENKSLRLGEEAENLTLNALLSVEGFHFEEILSATPLVEDFELLAKRDIRLVRWDKRAWLVRIIALRGGLHISWFHRGFIWEFMTNWGRICELST